MRFVVDECAGPAVARWLRGRGHDVFSVYDEARGIADDQVLAKAVDEERILVTNDKGFGEKVFRDGQRHDGVILLRLTDERAVVKIAVLERLLAAHADRIAGRFVVVTENLARFVNE